MGDQSGKKPRASITKSSVFLNFFGGFTTSNHDTWRVLRILYPEWGINVVYNILSGGEHIEQ
jgi:hypothetical protein